MNKFLLKAWLDGKTKDYLLGLNTPERRLLLLMKLEWIYWSTHSWFSENIYRDMSFEDFCCHYKKHMKYDYGYAGIWVRTGILPDEGVEIPKYIRKQFTDISEEVDLNLIEYDEDKDEKNMI
jgi:hypothetical protein